MSESLDSQEMTKTVNMRTAQNIPADGADSRTQPVANFTSSYVDKILTKKREFLLLLETEFPSSFNFVFVYCH